MSDVFISYSRRDGDFVRRLHEMLAAQNRDVWVDWEDIPATADWWNEICAGIDAADTFIFIISPDSVASEICRREIDHAISNNKRFVPVMYRPLTTGPSGVTDANMHPAISTHNWIYFRDTDNFEESFQHLINSIETDLSYVREHTRLLVRAREWERQGREKSFLLAGVDIGNAERWLAEGANKSPKPNDLQIEYIQASRRERTRQQRALFAGLAIGGVIAALALLSFALFQNANENLELANAARATLGVQVVTSDYNAQLAAAQATQANLNASTAIAAQGTSDANAADALTQEANARVNLQTAIAAQSTSQANAATAQAAVGTSDYNAADALVQAAAARENAATATVAQGQAQMQAQTAVAAQGTSIANAATAQAAQGTSEFNAADALTQAAAAEANAAAAMIAQGEAIVQARTAIAAQNTSEANRVIAENNANAAATAQTDAIMQAVLAREAEQTSVAYAGTAVAAQSTSQANAATAVAAQSTSDVLRVTAEGDALSKGGTAVAALETATIAQGEAIIQAQTAVAAQVTSDANALAAVAAQEEAQLQAATAQAAAGTATVAQGEAEFQAATAQAANATSVYNEQQARAQALAVGANQLLDAGFADVAIALAIESSQIDPSLTDAQRTLNRAAQFANRFNFPGTSRVDTIRYFEFGRERFREEIRYSFDGLFYTNPHGTALLVNSPDGSTLNLYDATNRQHLHSLSGHAGWVTAAVFSTDGRYLISGDETGDIIVWDVATGQALRHLSGQIGGITSLVYHPSRQEVISLSENRDALDDNKIKDSSAIWWNVETGEQLSVARDFDGAITHVFFVSNGTQAFAFAAQQDSPRRWRMEVGQAGTFVTLPAQYRGFSPDGFYGYIGGDGRTNLTLYTTSNNLVARPFNLDNNFITNIAFAPNRPALLVSIERRENYQQDGTYSVTDRYIELWDISRGERITNPETRLPYRIQFGFDNPENWQIHSMAYSPDGQYILFGGTFDLVNTVILWDVENWREIRRFTGHNAPIRRVAFSPNGQYAYTTAGSNTRVWDVTERETTQIGTVDVSSNRILQIAFSPDVDTNIPDLAGQQIYARTGAGLIGSWVIGGVRRPINSHDVGSSPLAFSPVDHYALQASSDNVNDFSRLSWLDMNSQQVIEDDVPLRASALAFSADGQQVVFGGYLPEFPGGGRAAENVYRLVTYDIASRNVIQTIALPDDLRLFPITQVALHPDYTLAAALFEGDDDTQTVALFDTSTGAEVQRYTGLPARINTIAFNPNGRSFAIALDVIANTVYVYDVETGDQTLTLIGHRGAVNTMAFSPDGATLLTGGDDMQMILWDTSNGQPLRRFTGHTGPILAVAFSNDGRSAISASNADGVYVWRIETLEETVAWTRENRAVIELTCSQRNQYNVKPLCIDGVVPTATATGTLLPTATPTATLTPTITPTPTDTPVPTGVIRSDTVINLRSSPNQGNNVIGRVAPNTAFIILGMSSDSQWTNIQLDDGTTGWVASVVVQPTTP
jgi:WD40 repeat protein